MTVQITLAHGSEREKEAASALRQLLDEHDLARWIFTDEVTIDEMAIGNSHPLTLGPKYLLLGADSALALFLHEQLHWLVSSSSGTNAALEELRGRYPDPPEPPEGAADEESTWLHLIVCPLEYLSLLELIGEERAQAALYTRQIYTWIYRTVVEQWDWFEELLARYGFRVPETPPEPQRFGKAGSEVSLGEGRAVLELATGNPREAEVADTLGELFDEFDLSGWIFAPRVQVKAMAPLEVDPPTMNTLHLGKRLGILAQWLFVQFAVFAHRRIGSEGLSRLTRLLDEEFWKTVGGPKDEVSVTAAVNELLALRTLLEPKTYAEAVQTSMSSHFYPGLYPRVGEVEPILRSVDLIAPGIGLDREEEHD